MPQNDPLGILQKPPKGKVALTHSDPLGILKKKEGGDALANSSGISAVSNPSELLWSESQLNPTTQFNLPKITTPAGAEIDFDETKLPAPNRVKTLKEDIQKRVSSGTTLPVDIEHLTLASGKKPAAVSAYLSGDNKTGEAVDRLDYIDKNRNRLNEIVNAANQNFGTSFSPDDVLSDPDKTSEFVQKFTEKLVLNDPLNKFINPDKAASVDRLELEKIVRSNPKLQEEIINHTKLSDAFNFINKPVLTQHIVESTIEQSIKNNDAPEVTLKKIAERTNPREYANAKRALAQRSGLDALSDKSNPGEIIGALMDEAKGVQDKDEMINAVIGQAAIMRNNAIYKLAGDKMALAHVSGNEEMATEAKQLFSQYDKDILDKYPSIRKQQMAAEISMDVARDSGNAEGSGSVKSMHDVGVKIFGETQAGYYKRMQDKGWFNDPKTKAIAEDLLSHPELFSDASYLGSMSSNVLQPFKDLGLSVADIGGIRNFKDTYSDKIKDQLFPAETPDLTPFTKGLRTVVNTTANLAGMATIAAISGGIGRSAGIGLDAAGTAELSASGTLPARTQELLTKAGTANSRLETLGNAMSFGLPSVDQNLKDSYDFIDNDAARGIYASMGAVLNTYGGKLLNLPKVSAVPGLKDVFAKLATGVADKTINQTAATELLNEGKNKYVNYLMKYGKNVSEGAAVMSYFSASNSILKSAFGDPNTTSDDILANTAHGFVDGVLGMLVFGAVKTRGDIHADKNSTFKGTLYKMAMYPDATEDIFKLGKKSDQDFNQKMQVLNTAVLAKTSLDAAIQEKGIELNPNQKAVWVANKTVEAYLRDQTKDMQEGEDKSDILKQADELREQSRKALDGLQFAPTLQAHYDLYDAEKQRDEALDKFRQSPTAANDNAFQEKKKLFDDLTTKYFENFSSPNTNYDGKIINVRAEKESANDRQQRQGQQPDQKAGQDQPREQPVTPAEAGPQKLNDGAVDNASAAPLTKPEHAQNIKDKFREVFKAKGNTDEHVDAAVALMDARAKSWASEEKGRTPDEWYQQIADVKNGEFQTSDVQYQKGGLKAAIVGAASMLHPIEAKDNFHPEISKTGEPKVETKSTALPDTARFEVVDARPTDVVSGKELTDKNNLTTETSAGLVRDIAREANKNGIDPYTAIAMALQETGLDDGTEYNPFHIRFDIHPKAEVEHSNGVKEGLKLLKEKFEYAKKLGKTNEADVIQAWNGYGKVGKLTEKGEEGANVNSWYGIDVSRHPIDMNKNPVYGNRVIDIRENVVKKNPEIVRIVEGEKGTVAFQQNKGVKHGALETLKDGRVIIHALDAPDVSTMVHEIFHVFEKDLTDAEKKQVKDFGGSEAFARAGERYLLEGKAPSKELQPLFDKFKNWLTNIYQSLKGSPLAQKISPEIKQIFDRLLLSNEETAFKEASKIFQEIKHNPAFDGMNEQQAIRFIADQSQNRMADGSISKLSSPEKAYETAKEAFGQDMVDAAIKVYPVEKKAVEAAKNTTPAVKVPEKAKKKFDKFKEKRNLVVHEPVISQDRAENEQAIAKLTEQDNPVQEPSVKAIEGKAESTSKTELAEVVKGATDLINAATDVHSVPVSELHTDEASFQNRGEGLDANKVQHIVDNYNPSEFDPITYWTDANGKKYTLNHHRFEAAKKLGLKEIPARALTYPKGHEKAGQIVPPTDKAEAENFAKVRSNANRSMETSIDRANLLRQLIEKGASKAEIEKFLSMEGKNKTFIQDLAALNPKGKAIETLKATSKSDDKLTEKEVEKIAQWVGAARRSKPKLTDAHENEMFDFLMDKDASKRITDKADFLSKVNSIAGGLDFNPENPLNIKRFKYKNEGEQQHDKITDELKGEVASRQQKINDINARFTNPTRKDYISTESKDYAETKKVADNNIAKLNAEIKSFQDKLQNHYREKGKFQGGDAQGAMFAVSDNLSPDAEEMKDIVKELIDNGVTKLSEIQAIAKQELGDLYDANTVEDAYHAAGKEDSKFQKATELQTGLAQRIKSFVGKIFGTSKATLPTVLKDSKAVMEKAAMLASGSDQPVQFQMKDGSGKEITVQQLPEGTQVINGFYSPIEKSLRETKVENKSAKQWLDHLGKGDEVTYTGLKQFLESKNPTEQVKKQDILDYLKDNRVQIVEVVKGEGQDLNSMSDEQLHELYLQTDAPEMADKRNREEKIADLKEWFGNDMGFVLNPDSGGTKYEAYQLPGEKSNYKEVLVTIPMQLENSKVVQDENGGWYVKHPNGSRSMGSFESKAKAEKLLADVIQVRKNGGQSHTEPVFNSSHFDTPNILVHLRMNTRIDAEGKKTLFIEEIQSDWAQKGKREGFSNKKATDVDVKSIMEDAFGKQGLEELELTPAMTGLIKDIINNKPDAADLEIDGGWTPQQVAKLNESVKKFKVGGVPEAPFVTDTNAWTKLGLKTALQHAISEGAERIAWTTGEQQNDRYDLSKVIEKIEYTKNKYGENDGSNMYEVKSIYKQGQSSKSYYREDELEGVVGKDMAEKIINGVGSNKGSHIEISGIDLKVGGKGMIGFYGSPKEKKLGIIGSVAESIFGKGSVKENKIPQGYNGDPVYDNAGNIEGGERISDLQEAKKDFKVYGLYAEDMHGEKPVRIESEQQLVEAFNRDGYVTKFNPKEPSNSEQHSVDITPQIRAEVERGLPMFMKNEKGEVLGFTHDGRIYLNGEHLNPNTPIHEAGHIWTEWAKEKAKPLYDKGMELVENTRYLQKVNANDFYKAEALRHGKEGSKGYIDYMKHEALAMAIGDKGAQFITEARKRNFRDWARNLWTKVAQAAGFKDVTPEQLQGMNFEDFSKRAAADILKGEANAADAKLPPPPAEPVKPSTPDYDPELTKMANAVNDAFIEGKFGEAALDKIMSQLQDTSTKNIYQNVKEKIRSGVINLKNLRERIMTTKEGSESDQAALMYDLAELKGQESALIKEINAESDQARITELQRQLQDVDNSMQDNALANRLIGRQASSIFRLRQLWVNREPDIVSMRESFKAGKGISELTPEQEKYVQDSYNAMREARIKAEVAKQERDAAVEEVARLKLENEKLESLKGKAKEQKKADRKLKSDEALKKSNERISKAKDELKDLRKGMNDVTRVIPKTAIIIGKIAAEKVYQGIVKFDELVRNVLDEVSEVFPEWTEEDVVNHLLVTKDEKGELVPSLTSKRYLESKKLLGTSDEVLREKTKAYEKAQYEVALQQFQWQKDRRSDMMDRRPLKERIIDSVLRWQRFAVLSYPSTIVKLMAVVAHQLVLKPFKFASQKLVASLTPESISSKQTIWGDPKWSALGKYYSAFIRNMSMANLKEQFKGIDTKELLYGRPMMYDEWNAAKGFLEIPGRSHGYIKSFIKNPEFQFAHEQNMIFHLTKMADLQQKLDDPYLSADKKVELEAEYSKVDITNEDVLERINKLSLEHGKWAILMNDNKFVDKFRKWTNDAGIAGALVKSEVPIVKIPVNYIDRYFLLKYGLIRAIIGKPKWESKENHFPGVAELIVKGSKSLSEDQANQLGRVLTSGTFGAAMFGLGYLLYSQVKKNDDGSAEMFGVHVSKNLTHSPELESLLSGSDMGKKKKGKKNLLSNLIENDVEVVAKNPFLTTLQYGFLANTSGVMVDIARGKPAQQNEEKMSMAVARKIGDMTIPGFVKQPAGWMDTKEAGIHPMLDPIKRKPHGDYLEQFWQTMELNIPGLRKNVPVKH